ncbi:MAG: serine hydrolase [Chitinophagaceae bacterium]
MKKLNCLFFFLAIAFAAGAQTAVEKADELLKAYADQYKFHGAMLIAKGDDVLLSKGYGYRNAGQKMMNTEASVFQIGSITKQFTAALILKLQEEGKLSVNDKLSKYFPQFPNGDKITIHHLLTHTSGIFNYTNDAKFMQTGGIKPVDQKTMFSLFETKPLEFEPGTKYSYSNSGYVLLGYIIEKVSGKSWETMVRQNILKPLQMNNTGFDYAGFKSDAKTTGYFSVSEVGSIPAPTIDSTFSYAAGSIYTTTADMLKWQRAIAKGKLLKKESWKKAMTPEKDGYGYGLVMDSLYGNRRIHHGGSIYGYMSYAVMFPEQDYTLIVFSNASNNVGKLTNDLAAILYNKPYTIPEANKEIKLDDAELQQYIGEYQLAPSFSITISLKDNYLYGQATGQPPFQMFAKSEKRFFLKAVEAEVEFFKDGAGKVTEMILYQNGREMKGQKK